MRVCVGHSMTGLFLFSRPPARLLAIGTISLCGVVQYILGMGRSKSFSPHLLFSFPPIPHLISFFVSFFPLPLSGRPLHFPRLRRRRGMRFLFPYLAARREKEATKKGRGAPPLFNRGCGKLLRRGGCFVEWGPSLSHLRST